MSEINKLCGQCRKVLPASSFHKRAASVDGLAACCKLCQRDYDAARVHAPHRVAARQKAAKKVTPLKKRDYIAAYWASYPQKRAANVLVGNAVRDGKITRQPCQACTHPKAQAHHDDYSKPLDVRWLCTKCHGAHHRTVNESERQRAREPV